MKSLQDPLRVGEQVQRVIDDDITEQGRERKRVQTPTGGRSTETEEERGSRCPTDCCEWQLRLVTPLADSQQQQQQQHPQHSDGS